MKRAFAKMETSREEINLVDVKSKILIMNMFEMYVKHLSLLLKKDFEHVNMELKERTELEVSI
jgi:hypothetical protein